MTRAMMLDSNVPPSFWPEAVATSVYLLNRLPTKILSLQTPLSELSKQASLPEPLTLEPRIFGCSVFVHIPKHERNKFEPCSIKCVFVGYGVNQKGYRCYHPYTRRLYTTLDCNFLETSFFYSSQLSGQGENHEKTDPLCWMSDPVNLVSNPVSDPVNPVLNPVTLNPAIPESQLHPEGQSPHTEPTGTSPLDSPETSLHEEVFGEGNIDCNVSQSTNDECIAQQEEMSTRPQEYVLPPRSTRGMLPKRYDPYHVPRQSKYPMANMIKGKLSTKAQAYSAAVNSEKLPRNVNEALGLKEWKEAMEEEMKALKKSGTWEKAIPPTDKKPVGCRWVYTIKRKADGSIERYKARLVAK